MLKEIRKILCDESGQVMVEYAILTSAVVLVMFAFLNTDVLGVFPDGIYNAVYYLVRGLMICAVLPFG